MEPTSIPPVVDLDATMQELSLLRASHKANIKTVEELARRNQSFAAERDQWKVRAEKAEKLVNGKALDKALAERDALRGEVSHLAKKSVDLEAQLRKAQREVGELVTKASTAKADFDRFRETTGTTLEAMQLARSKAQIDRDNAVDQARKLAEELEVSMVGRDNLRNGYVELQEEVNVLEAGLKEALQTIQWIAGTGSFKRYTDKDGKVQDPAGVNGCLEELPKLLTPELPKGAK